MFADARSLLANSAILLVFSIQFMKVDFTIKKRVWSEWLVLQSIGDHCRTLTKHMAGTEKSRCIDVRFGQGHGDCCDEPTQGMNHNHNSIIYHYQRANRRIIHMQSPYNANLSSPHV